MRFAVSFVVFVVALSCGAPPREGTIARTEFQFVHPDGSKSPIRIESIRDVVKPTELNKLHCKGFVCEGLAPGVYVYKVRLISTGRVAEGRALLYSPNELVTLEEVDSPVPLIASRTGMKVDGRITGLSSSNQLWVRMRMVFGNDFYDTKVNSRGEYQFNGVMQRGLYFIAVFQADRVVHNIVKMIGARTQTLNIIIVDEN